MRQKVIFVSIILLVLLASVVAAHHSIREAHKPKAPTIFVKVPVWTPAADRFFATNLGGPIHYNTSESVELIKPGNSSCKNCTPTGK